MKALFSKYRLFLNVGIVGAIGTVTQALLLIFLVELLRVYPVLANTIAAETVILMNFFLNNSWTFRDYTGRSLWIRLLTFNAVVLGSIAVQALCIWIGIRFIDARLYVVYMIVGIGIGWVINYLLYTRIIWFRRRSEEQMPTVHE